MDGIIKKILYGMDAYNQTSYTAWMHHTEFPNIQTTQTSKQLLDAS